MVDTTYSDLLLMIGGQVLFLFIIIVITVFGVDPIVSPQAEQSAVPIERLEGAFRMLGKLVSLPLTLPVLLFRPIVQWFNPNTPFMSFIK